MKTQKRGLSDVVTVTLIILLAIAAVVIVWAFVKSTLNQAGTEIKAASCVSVDITPMSCSYAGTTAIVVARNNGGSDVEDIKVLPYDASSVPLGIVDTTGCTSTKALTQKTCTATIAAKPAKIALVPVMNGKTCQPIPTTVPCT